MDRAAEAQQEQLDWLHELHEESKRQTALLAQIRQHTALLYFVGVVSVVFMVLGCLAWLAAVFGS